MINQFLQHTQMKTRQVILILIIKLSIPFITPVNCVTITSLFFFKDQDEAEQEGNSTLQELYLQTEIKNGQSSEASEVEEEDEGDGQRMPLSISK